MAKKSMLERELKRKKLVLKYAEKRTNILNQLMLQISMPNLCSLFFIMPFQRIASTVDRRSPSPETAAPILDRMSRCDGWSVGKILSDLEQATETPMSLLKLL